MAGYNDKFQKLKEKIAREFDTYKDFNEYREVNHPNCKDCIWMNVSGKNDEDAHTKDIKLQKADMLIKLQSSLSIITCHVINLVKNL